MEHYRDKALPSRPTMAYPLRIVRLLLALLFIVRPAE
jgi:hypothetical protein